MEFKSNIPEAISALEKAKRDICETIGTFATAEAQIREPVGNPADGDPSPGLMRRSTTYEVHGDNNGVSVGVTNEAVNSKGKPYPLYVEKGTSKMKAQPFLEPAVMDNLGKIKEIAGQKISTNMGGDK